VIILTTADRIDPVGYHPWTSPVVVAEQKQYVGKHRRPGSKSFSLRRMCYLARHAGGR
jgi:hypothetical protein